MTKTRVVVVAADEPPLELTYRYSSRPFRSRDMAKRQSVASNELLRRAYKYVARNTTLPTRVRHQAQLQLNQFPNKSRPEMVKERCVVSGRGRGIITEFGLCRVSCCGDLIEGWLRSLLPSTRSIALVLPRLRQSQVQILTSSFSLSACLPLQYQFRLKALAGELPGVRKASW